MIASLGLNAIAHAALRPLAQPIAVARQSALEPGGPEAERIAYLWNVMLVVGTIVTVAVLAGLVYALFRRRPAGFVPEADRPPDTRGERSNEEGGGRGHEGQGRPRTERVGVRWMVAAGIVVPVVVLLPILVITMQTLAAVTLPSRSVAHVDAPPAPGELVVEVTGRQYWWEVRYRNVTPQLEFETANELRIPVGQRVVVRLRSKDVIHSFWVPGLQGKMDLVPGRTNAIVLTAGQPGVWRGQCAEFCGVQHAKMAFTVVAESPERYEAWASGQRGDARAPADSAGRADQEAFLASGCVVCHAVRGTPAHGDAGPDLTHLASRLTLAAGTLPNALGHLHGWVADPQAVKPGSLMPAVPLDASQLHAIVRYVSTLQ
jgi:cytochrome c oxidase subunit 2